MLSPYFGGDRRLRALKGARKGLKTRLWQCNEALAKFQLVCGQQPALDVSGF